MSTELLTELNTFRATENLPPYKEWRRHRHLGQLEAYREAQAKYNAEFYAALEAAEEEKVKEPEVVEPVSASYKALRVMGQDKSVMAKPVDFIHHWLSLEANKGLKRKDAVAALVAMGINYYTVRTQYQYWFTAQKEEGKK